MRALLFGICVGLLTCISASCGSGKSLIAGAGETAGDNPASVADPSGGLGRNLPQLSEMPAVTRQLSLLGPGYFALPLDEMIARQGVTGGPGSITIDGGALLGFVVYGVYGFDGDNGPTSARITASAVSGEYFVGFSDFVAGTWSIAGPYTGSAEVEIPNTDAHTSASAYTSPKGSCFLAVLSGPGDSAVLTAVELGVQGGAAGPTMPTSIDGFGEAPDFYLSWSNSASYHDPDFAGYILQRAPLLDGSFSDLSPGLITETHFNDSTAMQDVLYRYRICAVDASGNRSIWFPEIAGPVTGEKANPVVKLDLPLGPLVGPVDVDFDFGESFDPEGEGITSYSLVFGTGLAPVGGAVPVYTVTLQPGCYTIMAAVECAGPPVRSASNRYQLVVYPRWQPAPVVVRDPYPPGIVDLRRLQRASGTLNTTVNRLTYFGFDISAISLFVYSSPGSDPTNFTVSRAPLYALPMGASDAFDIGGSTYFAYTTAEWLILAKYDGSTASQLPGSGTPDSGNIAAAYDGTQIWAFFDQLAGLDTNLRCVAFSTPDEFVAVPATGPLTAIDALYNPATNTIDVVYGGSLAGTTEWVRVDTATAAVVNSATLDPAVAATDIDLERDPATGRPIVLYSHTAIHRFRALDAFNVWTPEVQVDNSIANLTPLDLIVDDGTHYAYFRTGPANQAVLYRDDGGAWSVANTVAFSANSGYEVALLPQPGAADRALVLDMDSSRDYHLAQLHDDGTDTDIWQLPHCDGQGFDLQAAAGSDGLHAIWRSLSTFITRHAMSADGEVWSDPGDIGLAFHDNGLAADSSGNLYFSFNHAGSQELYWWDGAALNLRSSFPGSSSHRPFLSGPPASSILWCAYDNAASTMHYVEVNEPTYTDNPVVLSTTPVWEGVSNTLGLSSFCFSLVDGASAVDGAVCWSPDGASLSAVIYDPLLSSPLNVLGTPLTAGRTFASTSFLGSLPIFPEQAMFCSRGRLINPARYTPQSFEPPTLTDIIVGKDYSLFNIEDIFSDDVRNTVSCAMGYSFTGLVLISSGDGARSYFSWSNYGDWENLALPEGVDYMSMPQLVVGLDGRWHILYTNWLTDQVMCISTL